MVACSDRFPTLKGIITRRGFCPYQLGAWRSQSESDVSYTRSRSLKYLRNSTLDVELPTKFPMRQATVEVLALIVWLYGSNFGRVSDAYVNDPDDDLSCLLRQGSPFAGRNACEFGLHLDPATIGKGRCVNAPGEMPLTRVERLSGLWFLIWSMRRLIQFTVASRIGRRW